MRRATRSRRTGRAVLAVLLAGLACAAGGCGAAGAGGQSTGPAPSARTIPAGSPGTGDAGHAAYPAAAWGQFGNSAAKTGAASSAAAAGHLSVAWRAGLDGAVYGQPLVIGNLVVAATENDSLYALNSGTGQVAWRRHLGSPVPLADLPCGDIDPLGITGTPAYDRDNGLVYAVAELAGYRHVLFGLSVSSGAVMVVRDIPAPDGEARYDQQRPAVTIEDGRVYVTFGGLAGDCGPYTGSVVGVPVSGAGALVSYLVPTRKGGAIWGTAGPVAGPGGTLYVSSGNGAAAGGTFDGSDSVTALTPGLKRAGIFAPVTWGPGQRERPGPRVHAARAAARRHAAHDRETRHRVPAARRAPGRGRRPDHVGRGVQGVRRGGRQRHDRLRTVPGRPDGRQHRGRSAPRAVAGAGRGFGIPGDRRRRGLGERRQGRDPLRAGSGHRRGAGLGPPGWRRCRTSRRCRWRGRWRSSARIMA